MKTILIQLIVEALLCSGFPGAPAALLQSPGFGKLEIQSNPAGASIAINGKQEQQLTDFTYVVGQGNYTVSVAGGPGSLTKCSGDNAKTVSVKAGTTAVVTCSATGWQ